MIRDATSAAIGTAAGLGYLEVGGSYIILAIAGSLIGLLHWFYVYTHKNEDWSKGQSASEALKSMLFGLVVMPAAIDGSEPFLSKWGISTPSVKILVGAISAFAAVEIFSIALEFLRSKATR